MGGLNYWIKETNMMFGSIDDIIKNANTLALKYGKDGSKTLRVIPQPVMMTLENPLFRFSCMPEMKKILARSVAESIYALSGMNGGDFIWEFRDWEDPRSAVRLDSKSIGQPLRFWNEKTGKILNYANSNYLRQRETGFVDQFKEAAIRLTNTDGGFVISLRDPNRKGGEVHSACVWKEGSGRLRMMVSCGEINVNGDLIIKIIPAFGFIHQMLSEAASIPPGGLTIAAASLYYLQDELPRVKELSKAKLPSVDGPNDFSYPTGNLSVRDTDALIAIMQEFVGRLDEKSLSRANPYEGDPRVQFWSDMAEVFRMNKAEKLGCKVGREIKFYHPQLQYIYKGVSI
jgi:hypothetical protein